MGVGLLGALGGAALGQMAGSALGSSALMGSLATAINETPLLVGSGTGGLLGGAVTSQGVGAGLGKVLGGVAGASAGSSLNSLLGGGNQQIEVPKAPTIPMTPMRAGGVQQQALNPRNPGMIVGSPGSGVAGGPPISPQQMMLLRRLGLG